jgi:hypothetical protein
MVYIVSIYSGISFFLGNLQALFVTWTYWLLNLFVSLSLYSIYADKASISVVVVIIVINLYFRLYSKALQADWALLPEATPAPITSGAQKINGFTFLV